MKTIKIEKNKADVRFGLVQRADGFAVYKECANYSRHVRGGVAYTWRYVEKCLTLEVAKALFDRKIAGKARA